MSLQYTIQYNIEEKREVSFKSQKYVYIYIYPKKKKKREREKRGVDYSQWSEGSFFLLGLYIYIFISSSNIIFFVVVKGQQQQQISPSYSSFFF